MRSLKTNTDALVGVLALCGLVMGCSLLNNARIAKPDWPSVSEKIGTDSVAFIAKIETKPLLDAVALSLYFDGKFIDQVGVLTSEKELIIFGGHIIRLLHVAPERSGYVVWTIDGVKPGRHRVDSYVSFIGNHQYVFFGDLWHEMMDGTYFPLSSYGKGSHYLGCMATLLYGKPVAYSGLRTEINEPGVYYIGDISAEGSLEKVFRETKKGKNQPFFSFKGKFGFDDKSDEARAFATSRLSSSLPFHSLAGQWGELECVEVTKYLIKTE